MKKLITLIISCSLALAAGAMAQQDEAQATPGKKKQKQQAKAEARAEAQASGGAQAEAPADKPNRGMKAQERRAERQAARTETSATASETAPAAKGKARGKARMQTETPATDAASTTTSTDVKAEAGQRRKGRNANKAAETTTANETTATAGSAAPAQTKAQMRAEKRAQRQNQAQGQTDSTVATQATQPKARPGKKMKQLDTQAVQKIKTEHANFEAKARPQQVPAVTFSQSRTIEGSQNWQGENYTVFRSYRPERHDQAYYRSRYSRVELIGGGYYYFNAGYWYPAWGYQPSAQYYVYDGPIYAGRSAERLDRVIANVQASLQVQGYYTGEVDGLLGPLTRKALIGYQTDNGLYTTAAIDEPTLNALQLN
ncbi:MAG: peptidoglycan-binding protein [Spartobacteria bacterium]